MDDFTGYAVHSLLTDSSSGGDDDNRKGPGSNFDFGMGMILLIIVVACGCFILPIAIAGAIVEGIDLLIHCVRLKTIVSYLLAFILIDRLFFTWSARKLEQDVRDLVATPTKRNYPTTTRWSNEVDRYSKLLGLELEKERKEAAKEVERYYEEYLQMIERRKQHR